MTVEQGKMLLSAVRMQENTGKKALMLVEFHQMESGISQSILKGGENVEHLLSKTWIKILMKRLRGLNMWIELDHWRPETNGEKTVMDEIIGRNLGKEWEKKFNLCRQHFQVMWKDDLYKVDGRLCKRDKELARTTSKMKWPKAEIPSGWKNWWWEQVQDFFPGTRTEIKRRSRESTARMGEDRESVVYKGQVYKKVKERTRMKKFKHTIEVEHELGNLIPCEVIQGQDDYIEVIEPSVEIVESIEVRTSHRREERL